MRAIEVVSCKWLIRVIEWTLVVFGSFHLVDQFHVYLDRGLGKRVCVSVRQKEHRT